MSTRLLITTALTAFAVSTATVGAQAAVVGPSSGAQQAAQSLDVLHQARRICRQVFKCGKFPRGCWWERQCYITGDYPPERR